MDAASLGALPEDGQADAPPVCSRLPYQELTLRCVGKTFVVSPTHEPEAPALVLDRLTGAISLSRDRTPVGSNAVALTIFGILGFIDLLAGRYVVVVNQREEVASICGKRVYKGSFNVLSFAPNLEGLSSAEQKLEKTLIAMLQDVLQTPMHLISYDYDLTQSVQRNFCKEASEDAWQQCDDRFVWNCNPPPHSWLPLYGSN